MKKRLFMFLMLFTFAFAFTACGGDGDSSSKRQEEADEDEDEDENESDEDEDAEVTLEGLLSNVTTPDETAPEDEDTDAVEEPVTEDTIRENGKLPENKEDLTSAEKIYYVGEVMQAIIDLDEETLREYTDGNVADCIAAVKDDEMYSAVWEQTVGQSLYMEDSCVFVYKDPNYIFSKWIMAMEEQGIELREEIDEYSIEELLSFFDTYGQDAPYIPYTVDSYDYEIKIEDGRIIISCESIIKDTGWGCKIKQMCPSLTGESPNNEMLANLIFGKGCDVISLGLDYINADGEFPFAEVLLTGDLTQIIAAFDSATEYDLNAEITEPNRMLDEMAYQTYYKNPEAVATIQAWMDSNVKIVREIGSVYVYVLAETDHSYPYERLTEEEEAELEGLDIYTVSYIHVMHANTDREFEPFYEIITRMRHMDAIE